MILQANPCALTVLGIPGRSGNCTALSLLLPRPPRHFFHVAGVRHGYCLGRWIERHHQDGSLPPESSE
jgi:hypothetical protein